MQESPINFNKLGFHPDDNALIISYMRAGVLSVGVRNDLLGTRDLGPERGGYHIAMSVAFGAGFCDFEKGQVNNPFKNDDLRWHYDQGADTDNH